MGNCFPLSDTKEPLLVQEKQNEDSVETLLNRLQRRVRTLVLEAEQSQTDTIENRLRAEACAQKGDAVGARHYIIEARKAEYYYDLQLKQKSNVGDVLRKLRDAVVNVETGKSFWAATMTLEDLQKEMPLTKLDDIMETLTDHTITANQQSEILAGPISIETLEGDDVEAELRQLMERIHLPSVPLSVVGASIEKKTLILKSE